MNVNEEWLRNGTGEMFVPMSRNEKIASFVGGLMKESDSFKKRLINALAEMDENEWEFLEQLALKITKKD